MNASWLLRQRNLETNATQYTIWFIFTLGLSSIVLNAFVTVVIFVNRHRVLKNVFYMLVLHCAIVDVVRGLFLSAWCLPGLNVFPMETVIILTQAKKWIVLMLRSLNLLTILNLLVFTVNEFIVVKRPLQYRRIRRKRIVLLFVLLSWVISFSFALANAWAKSYGSNISGVYIYKYRFNFNSSEELKNSEESSYRKNSGSRELKSEEYLTTTSFNHSNVNYFSGDTNPNRLRRDHLNVDEFHYPFLFAIIAICIFCLITVFSCYAMILKKIRSFKNCTELKVGDQNYSKTCGTVPNGGAQPGTVRSKRMDSLVRNKYILVIGSVLVVDVLFLVPYSIIQLLQYINLTESRGTNKWSAQPRLILQFIIGIHSVLQPLCYFRMKDFRRLAMCKKMSTNKEFNSRSRPTLMNRPSIELAVEDSETVSKKLPSGSLRYFESRFISKKNRLMNYSSVDSQTW